MMQAYLSEFRSTLFAYVRTNAEGRSVDGRDAMARAYAAMGASSLLETNPMSYDVAAIFSGCVGVADPKRLASLARLRGKQLVCERDSLIAAPLHCAPEGHPAGRLFADLIASPRGLSLYVSVLALLSAAQADSSIDHLLYVPHTAPTTPTVEPLITAPVDEDALPDVDDDVSEEEMDRDGAMFSDEDDDRSDEDIDAAFVSSMDEMEEDDHE